MKRIERMKLRESILIQHNTIKLTDSLSSWIVFEIHCSCSRSISCPSSERSISLMYDRTTPSHRVFKWANDRRISHGVRKSKIQQTTSLGRWRNFVRWRDILYLSIECRQRMAVKEKKKEVRMVFVLTLLTELRNAWREAADSFFVEVCMIMVWRIQSGLNSIDHRMLFTLPTKICQEYGIRKVFQINL